MRNETSLAWMKILCNIIAYCMPQQNHHHTPRCVFSVGTQRSNNVTFYCALQKRWFCTQTQKRYSSKNANDVVPQNFQFVISLKAQSEVSIRHSCDCTCDYLFFLQFYTYWDNKSFACKLFAFIKRIISSRYLGLFKVMTRDVYFR